MKKDKVVYLHRKETDKSIFYVGMGSIARAYSKDRKDWWKRVVNKHGYFVEIVKDNLTQAEAFLLEIELIEKYGRMDLKKGQLINQTSGGEALNALIRTQEWRDKISLAHKGKIKSKEHLANMSKSRMGKITPDHVKEKQRRSNLLNPITAVPILCYDYLTSDFIMDFPSATEASRQLGCLRQSIWRNLNGRSKFVNSKVLNKQLKFKYKCNQSENF